MSDIRQKVEKGLQIYREMGERGRTKRGDQEKPGCPPRWDLSIRGQSRLRTGLEGVGWDGEPRAGTGAGRRYSRCIAEKGSALQCISMGRQRSGSSAAAAAVSPLKLNFRT